ncbi:MAG: cardiolipin hydrolase [Polyangiales bacterium]|jgi:cardiolipin hydrolase
MTVQEMERLLRETLEDRRVSRAERRSLRKEVDDSGDEHEFRRIAFSVAQTELAQTPGDAGAIIEWLEAVSKAVTYRAALKAEKVEAHFSPGDACRDRIAGAIGGARRSIDICVFTITDDHLVDAILSANARGVKVRVASDNDKAEDRGSDIKRMAREGLDVRMDRSPHHMHHKFAIFDDSLLLNGSYNWTRSAFKSNRENLLVTTHTSLVSQFSSAFDAMWNDFA